MRSKPIILLVVALGCGMIAAVAASKAVLNQGPAAAGEATVEIFVATKDLKQAQKISAENVKLDKWPKSRVPEGALTSLDQIEEKFTNVMIFSGEPILDRKIADSRESFSTTIPPGFRTFDIPGGSSSGYIKPGDHVDILGTFQLGGRHSVPESRTVMRNVKVHGINGITTRDSEEANTAKNTNFQLLVKESQLETLTLANTLADGKLRLNLRPFGEEEAESDEPDTGADFLDWISENEAPPAAAMLTTAPTSQPNAAPEATEPEGPKHEMVVITPNGIERYQWKDLDGLPQRVESTPASSQSPAGGAGNSSALGNTGGNDSEGYGGYGPTYPTDEAALELEGALNPASTEIAPGMVQRRK
ncbi:MAG: hypothetical protein Aurels2KO_00740 [Aureliella sp.]